MATASVGDALIYMAKTGLWFMVQLTFLAGLGPPEVTEPLGGGTDGEITTPFASFGGMLFPRTSMVRPPGGYLEDRRGRSACTKAGRPRRL
jgi:hypothetical protein